MAMVDEANNIATVEVSGVMRKVNVALVRPEGITPGDWVLIHAGCALSKIEEQEAQDTLQLLRMMGELYIDDLEMLQQSRIE